MAEADKQMKKIKAVCWGASGHAKSVVDALNSSQDIEIVGYLDDVYPERHGQLFEGKKILGGEEQLEILSEQENMAYILAFGHCMRRIEVGEMLTRRGCNILSVIHPKAIIAPDVSIGVGAVILAGAIIDSECTIGDYSIINKGAIINHGSVIGEGTHVCPGVNIAGDTTIGKGCWLGIGATIIEKLEIGDHVFLGAGSVVTEDLPSGYLFYGNPAKIINKIESEF